MPERESLAATASLLTLRDVADSCEQRRWRPAPRSGSMATSAKRLSAGPSTSAGNATETFHHGNTVPVMRRRGTATRRA